MSSENALSVNSINLSDGLLDGSLRFPTSLIKGATTAPKTMGAINALNESEISPESRYVAIA